MALVDGPPYSWLCALSPHDAVACGRESLGERPLPHRSTTSIRQKSSPINTWVLNLVTPQVGGIPGTWYTACTNNTVAAAVTARTHVGFEECCAMTPCCRIICSVRVASSSYKLKLTRTRPRRAFSLCFCWIKNLPRVWPCFFSRSSYSTRTYTISSTSHIPVVF